MGDGGVRLVIGDTDSKTRTQAALATTAVLGAALGIAAPHLALDRVDPVALPFGALVGDDLGQGLSDRAFGKQVPVAKDVSWDLERDDLYVDDFHAILLLSFWRGRRPARALVEIPVSLTGRVRR